MSEGRASFRVKKGEIEIEYEGKTSEVNERYEEVMEWIKSGTIIPPKESQLKEKKKVKKKKSEIGKEGKRGGTRTSVISDAINELIKEGFVDDFKRDRQVMEELRRKNVPVSGYKPVQNALNRRVPKTLDRIKDNERKWVYRRKQNREEKSNV